MKMKTLVFGLLALALGMSRLMAGSESALIDGNVTYSMIGTVHTSSGSNRAGESRRINVDETGSIMTTGGLTEVVYSSPTGISPTGIAGLYQAGNSTNTFAVNASSFVYGCRNIGDNCNVVRLASVAEPVFVKRITFGDVLGVDGNSGKTRVWLYDSRGSTATAGMFFSVSGSTGAQFNVDHWCSSGTTIRKDSRAELFLELGRQNR